MSDPRLTGAALGTAVTLTFGAVASVAAYREIGWIGVGCVIAGGWMAAILAILFWR